LRMQLKSQKTLANCAVKAMAHKGQAGGAGGDGGDMDREATREPRSGLAGLGAPLGHGIGKAVNKAAGALEHVSHGVGSTVGATMGAAGLKTAKDHQDDQELPPPAPTPPDKHAKKQGGMFGGRKPKGHGQPSSPLEA